MHRNERLTREILDLMTRLEKIAQARYAGGLAAQQDVIRAQVEQTGMRNELIAVGNRASPPACPPQCLAGAPSQCAAGRTERAAPAAGAGHDSTTPRWRSACATRNPQLFADEARIKAAEKNRDLDLPQPLSRLHARRLADPDRNAVKEWELMVELNIPLQQASRAVQERESEAMLDAARSRKEATRQPGARPNWPRTWPASKRRGAPKPWLTNSLLPQAELTFQAALAGYENGKVDFATLLDAQRQIRQARQDQHQGAGRSADAPGRNRTTYWGKIYETRVRD